VVVSANQSLDAANAFTVTNSGTARTWTRRNTYTPATDHLVIDQWFNNTGSSVSMTVTVTYVNGDGFNNTILSWIGSIGGSADPAVTAPLIAATIVNASTAQATATPTQIGSLFCLHYFQNAPTADVSSLVAGSARDASPASTFYLSGGPASVGTIYQTAVNAQTASPVTVGATLPTGAQTYGILVEYFPPAAATPAPVPQPGRFRQRVHPQRRRRTSTAPLRVTVTLPAQPVARRRAWLPPRKPHAGQPVPAAVVVVTTQQLPPQPARRTRTWLALRRARAAQPVPAQVIVQTTQALPPQPGHRPPRLPAIGRHRTAQVVPAQVVVVTVQALPPQSARRPRPAPSLARHRTAQVVPAAIAVVTVQALPPQPTRRPVRPLLTRRPHATPPPLTVAVAFPPQNVRRRVWAPVRRRPRAAQPVPAQVIIVTAQALPPQPTRRLRWLPQRRRNQLGQPVPPQAVVVVSIPVTVTGSDRPTTTVTGSDRPSAAVTGSDQATVTITSQ